jgi:hypothetical protein
MNWRLLGRLLRLAFFLRIPLLTILLLAALGPISQFSGAQSLLGNLFDQRNDANAIWWNMFAVSFAAFLLAFTAITALNLVLHYGTDRFHFEMSQKRPGLTFLLGTLAACVLVGTAVRRTEGSVWISISAALVAFVCALGITLGAKIIQLALTDSSITPHPPPFLVFPAYRWRWLEDKLDALYCWPPPDSKSWLARLFDRLKYGFNALSQWGLQIFQNAGQGYLSIVESPEGERLKLRSGHVFAVTLSLLAFLTYVLVGIGKANITAAPANVPALAYVLLFFIVACWFLSALTFFFDRYRFPLVLSVIILASLTASVPQSDHFFRVETSNSLAKLQAPDATKYLTPSQYLAERSADPKHRRLIFVATPGGGIQAAAWTAKVLNELDYRFPDVSGANGFRKSVAFISSVSGGSLGSMIYAASFAGNVDRGCIAENAKASAIDEVAWGWTGPDLWRTIVPLFLPHPQIDRGWALEQKWAAINGLMPEPNCPLCTVRQKNVCIGKNPEISSIPAERETYLSDWAAQRTNIPALVFNSMLVERGQHVVFSTTQFPPPNDPRGIANFYDLYAKAGQPPFDIRVYTAARLSASFPYVAVAARPNLYTPYVGDFHYVDGGYYDNLGIDSLIGWVGSAYDGDTSLNHDLPEILVLQIRHFNAYSGSAPPPRRGWSFQLFAPLVGLLNMWNNAPAHRDQNELQLFIDDRKQSGRGPTIQTVTIPYCGLDYSKNTDTEAEFEDCIKASGGNFQNLAAAAVLRERKPNRSKRNRSNCADQPLSWKLSLSQKECIDETWKEFARDDPNGSLHVIQQFLAGAPLAGAH